MRRFFMRKVFIGIFLCIVLISCEMPINVSFENHSDFDISLTVEDFKSDITFIVPRHSVKYMNICKNTAHVIINTSAPITAGYNGSHNFHIYHLPKTHVYIKNTTGSPVSFSIVCPYDYGTQTITANENKDIDIYVDEFLILTEHKFYSIEPLLDPELLEPDYSNCYSLVFY